MYPHERSLVEKYADDFAIVGLNSDKDPVRLKRRMKEENITWRSWFDGSTKGPIATSWGVTSWPTMYVLDHHGVIRFKGARGDALDAALEELIGELRRDSGRE